MPLRKIEAIANGILGEWSQRRGLPVTPPVDVQDIAETVAGLEVVWTHIPERPRERIWAGLMPGLQRIVLNEAHRDFFRSHWPGFTRFCIAHELGHWELHADKTALKQLTLPDLPGFGHIWRDGSKDSVERQADKFSGALLIPRHLLSPYLAQLRSEREVLWRDLYRVAQEFGVTISALRVRLEELNWIAVGSDGKIYRSREEADGQTTLF